MRKTYPQFSLNAIAIFVIAVALFSCSAGKELTKDKSTSGKATTIATKPVGKLNSKAKVFIQPVQINRDAFVKYAKTLLGTRYQYGSINPARGLDCSGFVFNVFQHFKVSCPRVTKDYTNEGREVTKRQARVGDIILFTGSDNSTGIVGHMGIITKASEPLQFIHSASGKSIGVIINDLKGYYETHFVKIISVLE